MDDPELGQSTGYAPKISDEIARLPYVEQSATSIGFDGNIDLGGVKGVHPHASAGETPPTVIGGSEYLTLDKVTLIAGHLFDSRRPNEAVINMQAAREMGVHVGCHSVPFYSDKQATSSNYNGPPYTFPKITIVGEIVINRSVVEDEIEALGDSVVFLSPKLTDRLAVCCSYYSGVAIVVKGGVANVARVKSEVDKIDVISKYGVAGGGSVTQALAQAQQEIKPEAIALGVFGLIAGIAVLLIGGLTIGRMLRTGAAQTRTLQALGANNSMAIATELIGVALAVVTGALLAVALAVGLSPLAPLGPVRFVYPYRGISFDWSVLGLGVLAMVLALGTTSLVLARRELSRMRLSRRLDQTEDSGSLD